MELLVQYLKLKVISVEVSICWCFFCGIFGHKHSPYFTPDGGKFPPTSGDAKAFLARSPMC